MANILTNINYLPSDCFNLDLGFSDQNALFMQLPKKINCKSKNTSSKKLNYIQKEEVPYFLDRLNFQL